MTEKLHWKHVGVWDSDLRIYRVGRFVWPTGKFSIALSPRLFGFRHEYGQWMLTLLGLRLQLTHGGAGYV